MVLQFVHNYSKTSKKYGEMAKSEANLCGAEARVGYSIIFSHLTSVELKPIVA